MDSIFVDQDAIARSISHLPPAHYILKIESFSLLAERAVEKYESGEFEDGGYKWKLVLHPNGNKSKKVKDHISLYLSISSTSSLTFGWEVYAVFRLFLLDQNQDKYLIVQGYVTFLKLDHNSVVFRRVIDAVGKERRFYGLKHEWRFDQFIPLKGFQDDSNGYLVEDACAFGAEVFVKERNTIKGECLSMINDTSSVKHVWKIENFSKLDAEYHISGVFSAGGYKWKIKLYPNGDSSVTGNHLSLFLVLADSGPTIYVEFTLRILNQVWARHRSLKSKSWIASGLGWSTFVSLSYLNEPGNGCLVNDVCVVEAEVTVLGISKAL